MDERQVKEPMSRASVLKLMRNLVYIVSSFYLIKDLIGGAYLGAIIIGSCLFVFTLILIIMKKANVSDRTKRLTVSLSLAFLVFIISLNSGAYYSDDYCLYVAVMGLAGLFLESFIIRIEAIIIPVLLVIQFLIHPEKVESTGQFITCVVIFILASYIINLMVARGEAFILIGNKRAKQAEKLLNAITEVGVEVKTSIEHTNEKHKELEEINSSIVSNVEAIKSGSYEICDGNRQISGDCDDVRVIIQQTEKNIEKLNNEVGECERAITLNGENLEMMSDNMEHVKDAVTRTNEVFDVLEKEMKEIFGIIEELKKIASGTTMLALNASIEAARAGEMGKGFAVVATNVQSLATDSNACSKRVEDVLMKMKNHMEETMTELKESTSQMEMAFSSLNDCKESFGGLTQKFTNLYENIEEQNEGILNIEEVFETLKEKIFGMNEYSEKNQAAVETISDNMSIYQNSIQSVVESLMQLDEVTKEMLK